ncbi:hypothetical protein B7P43_G02526 [Cryptotermes secundus]|uniref:Mos1 transposase HTH domain-containing protein n=1 Tax=Cryptotermes secundus TaxID=105785 RepID=A0A2J7Q2G9_9NEOP|nr:hypothetical protein B7P43_G02526 [Cryptotermes secundus]
MLELLVKLSKSGREIGEMLVQVHRDNAMKKTAVYKLVTRFSEGRESDTDEDRSGRPTTSRTEENIAKVCQLLRENCRLTIRNIAETEYTDTRKACASVRELLASKQKTVLEHPPHSPYLTPNNFFVPEHKGNVKLRHFNGIDDIRINRTVALKAIPQNQGADIGA